MVRVAEERRPNPVLMFWREAPFARRLLGGTVGHVLRNAGSDVAVLIDPARQGVRLKREAEIAVPFGGGFHEEAAIDLALRLADHRMYAKKGSRRSSAREQTHNVLLGLLKEREPKYRQIRARAVQRGTAPAPTLRAVRTGDGGGARTAPSEAPAATTASGATRREPSSETQPRPKKRRKTTAAQRRRR